MVIPGLTQERPRTTLNRQRPSNDWGCLPLLSDRKDLNTIEQHLRHCKRANALATLLVGKLLEGEVEERGAERKRGQAEGLRTFEWQAMFRGEMETGLTALKAPAMQSEAVSNDRAAS